MDLIDEAASKLRIDADSLPADLKSTERRIQEVSREEEAAAQRSDYEQAAQLKMERLRLEQEYTRGRDDWLRDKKIDMIVDAEVIAQLISKWTGIPVSNLLEEEAERLVHMEDSLHRRVVGQEEAVVAVSEAIRRARSGLADPKRPIGSFIFLGPTGVGKTELSRALSEFLFDDEANMVRVDMSEYMEKHTVSRLIGAPRVTWASTREASLPSLCAGIPSASSCSTRSKRPIQTCSTCCSRSWRTGVLRTATA